VILRSLREEVLRGLVILRRPKGEWKVRKHERNRWRGERRLVSTKKTCVFVILRSSGSDLKSTRRENE
jgi:hypothetical protein